MGSPRQWEGMKENIMMIHYEDITKAVGITSDFSLQLILHLLVSTTFGINSMLLLFTDKHDLEY